MHFSSNRLFFFFFFFFFFLLLLLLLLCGTAPLALGSPNPPLRLEEAHTTISRACGTGPPSEGLRSAHAKLHGQHRLRSRQAPAGIVVDTYMHFVTTLDQAHLYTQDAIAAFFNDQATVLNTAYSPANITFRILPYTYTINTAWATDTASSAMKSVLRTGSYAALNLYFQTNLSAPSQAPNGPPTIILGHCTLPTVITHPPATPCPSSPSCATSVPFPRSAYASDGCNILAQSMPGGPLQGYNLGGTAVHEVGHWFGLLHTFQGESCANANPGDYIDDTRQEATSTQGCPVGKDTCPGKGPGGDPVWNFMDYSSDECYTGFSPGQNARMVTIFKLLRQGN